MLLKIKQGKSFYFLCYNIYIKLTQKYMTMFSAWPYILRLALATYFAFNHVPALMNGFKNVASGSGTLFSCASTYISPLVSYNLWHGAFVLLAALILFWPRPILFLSISLFILFAEAYISFDMNKYGPSTVLIIICTLINLALLIIYGRPRRY